VTAREREIGCSKIIVQLIVKAVLFIFSDSLNNQNDIKVELE